MSTPQTLVCSSSSVRDDLSYLNPSRRQVAEFVDPEYFYNLTFSHSTFFPATASAFASSSHQNKAIPLVFKPKESIMAVRAQFENSNE